MTTRTRAKVGLAAMAALGWLLAATQEPAPQDPQRPPAPPADAAPLPPVSAPYVEPVLRADLPERFAPRDPLEGVWQLRECTRDGVVVEAGQGCMAIGRRFLMAQFQAPGPDPDQVLLRADTWRWSRADELGTVRLVLAFGHFNDDDEDVHLQQPGTVETRRFELHDDRLRVYQDDLSWLDFVRLE